MIGKIYKIVHLQSDLYYIGMTTNTLTKRWQSYKCDYNKDNHSKISIYPYMIKYGIENFKILLIKEYEVCDKQHLKVFETLWINKLNSINKVPSFNPMTYKNKKFKKHLDHICYLKNREERILKVRNYANNNKDKIKERNKLYREKNKDKIKERKSIKYICECGIESLYEGKARHERSQRHINFIQQKNI